MADAQTDIERYACRAIREAAWAIEAWLREITVARDRQSLWRDRVAGLVQKREAEGVTAFDITNARLEWLHAQSDTLHAVVAWRIAQVKLKQAQGLLASNSR